MQSTIHTVCVCCFEQQIIPKGCWIRLKGIHLSWCFQISSIFTVILKGVLVKDHVVKLEREKELKQKTNTRFSFSLRLSWCPAFSFRHLLHDPEMFENSHLMHKENVKVHSKCTPHTSWSCDCSPPPLYPSSEEILRFVLCPFGCSSAGIRRWRTLRPPRPQPLQVTVLTRQKRASSQGRWV